MEQYISKDALVAKIDNILDYADEHWDTDYAIGAQKFADKLQDAIDTLEVREVDLEKEYKDFVDEDPVYNKLVNGVVGKAIAKHFFDLGLKAQKGE